MRVVRENQSLCMGDDYHQVMKERLYKLYEWLENEVITLSGRVFVDSAPVMDKVWAQRSGLGWVAKNTNLIHPRIGSWFFIGTLIVDVPLTCDLPFTHRSLRILYPLY